MKKDIILNLLIIVIIICLGLAIWFVIAGGVKLEKWTEPEETKIENQEAKEEAIQPTPAENKEVKEEIIKEEIIKEEKIEERSIDREEIMTYVDSHISSLVKKIAYDICATCGTWEVTRFGFTSDEDAYVEYKYNQEPGRILIHCTGTLQNLNISVLAYFEPGADMWNLVKGKDTQFGKKIEFYEKNEKGNWVSIHK